MSTSPRLLIADDQRDVREALRLLVAPEGFEVVTATSPERILEVVAEELCDVVLIDMNYTRDTTSGREGLDLLARLKATAPDLPIVVMTAWGSVGFVVEAMRNGARDFIEKPWDNTRLLHILRTQAELGRALERGRRLEAENRMLRPTDGPTLVAESKGMRRVLELIERVGPSDANVLITGENGTGKGVVARALHAVSTRGSRPLVTVNIGGIANSVFESELFGHVRGAYTDARSDRMGRFEVADSGTLFLDEIANISSELQAKLLRVLETGELERLGSSRTVKVDVRILSATNADLGEEVDANRFRQDLLFRLNTVEIPIPALRERGDDISILAQQFLAQQADKYRRDLDGFEPDALTALAAHTWPGNVRELEHAIERAVLMARGTRIAAADLGLQTRSQAATSLEELSLEDVERVLIQKALDKFDGNVSRAAEALGLSRSALYRRLKRHVL